ncbi:hypothetical protein A2331_04235 [Candidatus Falkowbacteria bacterium RIFOXYB2_FULL_34_18]|uniref:DUF3048 domain-containing protein n=1 Tax=Candidatus Falkowbacteria bacterium RIFOXYD2_FULL_34_120 TaxID=1798007 RepID=A0A1F5TNE6_9BACT|nr:MAG: hypothetical protein A2500_00020 [Candidatus Falkowbacteria bacterium RIFOXYC12_FULL_34_55]OGF28835.1 MAG: hypothetical protein A2331_04235 [Candidatus Falkowbacteria bacterium RIFOXYB2_FULL_34_18]OGF38387.1 MAG: hypothetical protein A2515_06545 [Candidatus Falkowbacteria bacterium RIFOXYD12_FULL_34_57]OGF40377.1 MAG: hypothetical protein A2531_00150 [Candidatus Falkowbacteria bacterium RIFOXYD2_FULL_34_120]
MNLDKLKYFFRDKIFRNSKIWFLMGIMFFIASIFLVVLLSINLAKIRYQKKQILEVKRVEETQGEDEEIKIRRSLDGVYVSIGEENNYPVAVMIDNHPGARPQSSLARANLVYEAEAEGGITRYLAIYADLNDLKEIGPIRSARPYFIDLARETSALYVHVGGSAGALAMLAQNKIPDMNEFYNGKYFWRDTDRTAPHNIYTSQANLEKYLQSENLQNGKYLSWKYKDDLSGEERSDVGGIKIGYRSGFTVSWQYDKQNNNYLRYLNSRVHTDRDGHSVAAKNILVQVVPAEEIDKDLRLKMEIVGTGKAVACLDGECQNAYWRKKTTTTRTRFYIDSEYVEEIELNGGTTWVEIVRPEIIIEY